jgi:hypothetical protein
MRIGEGAWSAKQMLCDGEGAWSAKQMLCDGEGASAALGRKREGRGRQTLSVEVKIHLASPSDL